MTVTVKLSESEWTVMTAAWEKSPATVREVHARVLDATGWAYTTVKTLMDRLVEKGALAAVKDARVTVYEPLVSRDAARHDAVRSLLDRAFDGALGTLVQHLVTDERLGPEEREELRRIAEGVSSSEDGLVSSGEDGLVSSGEDGLVSSGQDGDPKPEAGP